MLYLSGPMTGLPNFNYDAFNNAATTLRDLGNHVFNPAECFGGRQDLAKEEYMRADIKAVLEATVVVTLPNWEKSTGAQLEVEVAKAIGIPVISLEDILKQQGEFHHV